MRVQVTKTGQEITSGGAGYKQGETVALGIPSDVTYDFNQAHPKEKSVVAFATINGVTLGVGANGTVVKSTNLKEWEYVDAGITNNFVALVTLGDKFVGFGSLGEVLISSNGSQWDHTTTLANKVSSAASSGAKVLGVTSAGEAFYSADGFTWFTANIQLGESFFKVVHSKDKFVAIGKNSIAISTIGSAWSVTTTTETNLDIFASQTAFYRVTESSVMSSSDAVTWVVAAANNYQRYGVKPDGKFYAFGTESNSKQNRYEGDTLASLNYTTTKSAASVVMSVGGELVTAGNNVIDSGNLVFAINPPEAVSATVELGADYISTSDATLIKYGQDKRITKLPVITDSTIKSIVSNGKVALMLQGTEVKRTTDGGAWVASHTGVSSLMLVDSKFTILAGSTLKQSEDGVTWVSEKIEIKQVTTTGSPQIHAVLTNGSLIASINDGFSWVPLDLPQGAKVNAICDRVFVGDNGLLGVINEATKVSIIPVGTTENLRVAASNNGKIIAGGDNGCAVYVDGSTVYSQGTPTYVKVKESIAKVGDAPMTGAVFDGLTPVLFSDAVYDVGVLVNEQWQTVDASEPSIQTDVTKLVYWADSYWAATPTRLLVGSDAANLSTSYDLVIDKMLVVNNQLFMVSGTTVHIPEGTIRSVNVPVTSISGITYAGGWYAISQTESANLVLTQDFVTFVEDTLGNFVYVGADGYVVNAVTNTGLKFTSWDKGTTWVFVGKIDGEYVGHVGGVDYTTTTAGGYELGVTISSIAEFNGKVIGTTDTGLVEIKLVSNYVTVTPVGDANMNITNVVSVGKSVFAKNGAQVVKSADGITFADYGWVGSGKLFAAGDLLLIADGVNVRSISTTSFTTTAYATLPSAVTTISTVGGAVVFGMVDGNIAYETGSSLTVVDNSAVNLRNVIVFDGVTYGIKDGFIATYTSGAWVSSTTSSESLVATRNNIYSLTQGENTQVLIAGNWTPMGFEASAVFQIGEVEYAVVNGHVLPITNNTVQVPNITIGSAIAHANGKYVCVIGGEMYYSTDTSDWVKTNHPLSLVTDVRYLQAENNLIAGFYATGGGRIISSVDGATWTFQENAYDLNNIAKTLYGNVFNAAGEYTVTDGMGKRKVKKANHSIIGTVGNDVLLMGATPHSTRVSYSGSSWYSSYESGGNKVINLGGDAIILDYFARATATYGQIETRSGFWMRVDGRNISLYPDGDVDVYSEGNINFTRRKLLLGGRTVTDAVAIGSLLVISTNAGVVTTQAFDTSSTVHNVAIAGSDNVSRIFDIDGSAYMQTKNGLVRYNGSWQISVSQPEVVGMAKDASGSFYFVDKSGSLTTSTSWNGARTLVSASTTNNIAVSSIGNWLDVTCVGNTVFALGHNNMAIKIDQNVVELIHVEIFGSRILGSVTKDGYVYQAYVLGGRTIVIRENGNSSRIDALINAEATAIKILNGVVVVHGGGVIAKLENSTWVTNQFGTLNTSNLHSMYGDFVSGDGVDVLVSPDLVTWQTIDARKSNNALWASWQNQNGNVIGCSDSLMFLGMDVLTVSDGVTEDTYGFNYVEDQEKIASATIGSIALVVGSRVWCKINEVTYKQIRGLSAASNVVAFNGVFVLHTQASILKSANGLVWQVAQATTTGEVDIFELDSMLFVSVGNITYASSDGSDWSELNLGFHATGAFIDGSIYTFVGSDSKYHSTTDLQTWTVDPISGTGTTDAIMGVVDCFNGKSFMIAGKSVFVSNNMVAWKKIHTASQNLNSLYFDGTNVEIVGDSGLVLSVNHNTHQVTTDTVGDENFIDIGRTVKSSVVAITNTTAYAKSIGSWVAIQVGEFNSITRSALITTVGAGTAVFSDINTADLFENSLRIPFVATNLTVGSRALWATNGGSRIAMSYDGVNWSSPNIGFASANAVVDIGNSTIVFGNNSVITLVDGYQMSNQYVNGSIKCAAVFNGEYYAGATNGSIFNKNGNSFNIDSGSPVNRLLVVGGVLYAACNNNQIRTKNTVWESTGVGKIDASPITFSGRISGYSPVNVFMSGANVHASTTNVTFKKSAIPVTSGVIGAVATDRLYIVTDTVVMSSVNGETFSVVDHGLTGITDVVDYGGVAHILHSGGTSSLVSDTLATVSSRQIQALAETFAISDGVILRRAGDAWVQADGGFLCAFYDVNAFGTGVTGYVLGGRAGLITKINANQVTTSSRVGESDFVGTTLKYLITRNGAAISHSNGSVVKYLGIEVTHVADGGSAAYAKGGNQYVTIAAAVPYFTATKFTTTMPINSLDSSLTRVVVSNADMVAVGTSAGRKVVDATVLTPSIVGESTFAGESGGFAYTKRFGGMWHRTTDTISGSLLGVSNSSVFTANNETKAFSVISGGVLLEGVLPDTMYEVNGKPVTFVINDELHLLLNNRSIVKINALGINSNTVLGNNKNQYSYVFDRRMTSVTVGVDGVFLNGYGFSKVNTMTNTYEILGLTKPVIGNAVLADKIIYFYKYGESVTTTDGVTWVKNTAYVNPGDSVDQIAYSKVHGLFVAAGEAGVKYGTDGNSWVDSATVITGSSVIAGEAGFLVVNHKTGKAYSSVDGSRWSYRPIYNFTSSNGSLLASDKGVYVLPTSNGVATLVDVDGRNSKVKNVNGNTFILGVNGLLASGEGVPMLTDTTTKLVDMAYGNDVYVVVGEGGKWMTSADGVLFTSRNTRFTNNLNGVAYDYSSKAFVAVSSNGRVVKSVSTGFTNTKVSDFSLNGIASAKVTVGNDTWSSTVIVGDNGTILSYPSLAAAQVLTSQNLRSVDIAYYGSASSRFMVAVGDNGTIVIQNGYNSWVPVVSGTTNTLRSVSIIGRDVIITGDNDTVIKTTVDLLITQTATKPTTLLFSGLAYNEKSNTYSMKAGDLVVTSKDLVTWSFGVGVDNFSTFKFIGKQVAVSAGKVGIQELSNQHEHATITSVGANGAVSALTILNPISSGVSFAASTQVDLGVNKAVFNTSEGRVSYVDSNGVERTVNNVTPALWEQRGFKVTSAKNTRVMVASRLNNATPIKLYGPLGTNSVVANRRSAVNGGVLKNKTCVSEFPINAVVDAETTKLKYELIDYATGNVEISIVADYAKMNDTMIATAEHTGGNNYRISIYVKRNGSWTNILTHNRPGIVDIDVAEGVEVAVFNSTTGAHVYHTYYENSVLKAGRRHFIANGSTFDYKDYVVVPVFADVAPYSEAKISNDGSKVCMLAYSAYQGDFENEKSFGAHPVVFDVSGSSASVVTAFWDGVLPESGRSFKDAYLDIPFYNNDRACYSYDIAPNFGTIVVGVKSDNFVTFTTVKFTNGINSPNTKTVMTNQLQARVNHAIALSKDGSKFAVCVVNDIGVNKVIVMRVGSQNATSTTSNTEGYGTSLVFGDNANTLFIGDYSFNHKTAGVGGVFNHVWSILTLNPEFAGENINSMVVGVSGGRQVVPCPDITFLGVGNEKQVTQQWPHYSVGGGGKFIDPASITLEVKSIN